ncbi:hypothetical protein TWF106_008787 [Orbilia oligospora]|uniref:Uncharacterized protein n=2 Tax=Orbilia oligospora TaxID=2813651 RepID=A0A6G1M5Q0_ORBOL|nr:hypothetical protein TWF788_003678 [Orbilia oligospora]KAF3209691.1 hypothetical protein TWF679_007228 [Orbilia oligospora]KAF3215280.1 hypothetical protein TWF106_008787 [Orbilia oligospora]KAF3244730.1 hypothetical protein TWF192_007664 [Orbilia oligospora]
MAIFSTFVAVLAIASTAYTAAVPDSRFTVWPRQENNTLAAGILETPLVFGAAKPDLANPEASFLFSNPAYYSLQQYVYNGMQLASSNEIFENTYNKAQFEQAVSNSGVYGLTQTTFVGINTHCNNFWTNTIGQMTFFAENISLFGRNAGKIYREISHLLDVMASIPRNQRSSNPVWLDSLIDVYNYVERLHDQMGIAQNQSLVLLGNINAFRAETITDMGNLNQVDRLLNTTNQNVYQRVQNMNAEITRLKGEINAANEDYEAAAKNIRVGRAGYSWVWPIGTAVYLGLSKKWRKEMEAATNRKNQAIIDLNNSQAMLQTFIHVTDDLQLLQLQTDSVLDYIDSAVGLLGNASDAFSRMSASITAIMVELESEADSTNPETIDAKWFSDSSFRMSLNATAEHWDDIYTEAAAFKGTAAIKIVSEKEAIRLHEENAQAVLDTLTGGSKLLRRAIMGTWHLSLL